MNVQEQMLGILVEMAGDIKEISTDLKHVTLTVNEHEGRLDKIETKPYKRVEMYRIVAGTAVITLIVTKVSEYIINFI